MTQEGNEVIFHTNNVESRKSTSQLQYRMQAFKNEEDTHPDSRTFFGEY